MENTVNFRILFVNFEQPKVISNISIKHQLGVWCVFGVCYRDIFTWNISQNLSDSDFSDPWSCCLSKTLELCFLLFPLTDGRSFFGTVWPHVPGYHCQWLQVSGCVGVCVCVFWFVFCFLVFLSFSLVGYFLFLLLFVCVCVGVAVFVLGGVCFIFMMLSGYIKN